MKDETENFFTVKVLDSQQEELVNCALGAPSYGAMPVLGYVLLQKASFAMLRQLPEEDKAHWIDETIKNLYGMSANH